MPSSFWRDKPKFACSTCRIAAAGLAVAEVPSFERSRIHGVSNLSAFSDGIRVLQAAGRVIRSGEDKGTVLFVGQRFGTAGYKRLFTPEYEHSVTVASIDQVAESLSSMPVSGQMKAMMERK